MKTSNLFSLNWKDVAKACIIATLTPVLVLIQQSISNGVLTFDWKALSMAAIAGFVGYLLKNFFTAPTLNDQEINNQTK